MKIMKKHLSLLLAIAMLCSLVIVSTAITVSADPTTLLELDFSNFEAVAYSAATEAGLYGQTSGVTASGTLAASTSLGFSKRPSENQLTKGSIHNSENGYTYYIDTFDEKTWSQSNQVSAANNYSQHLSNMQFKNNNLESTSNTFSFWVDADYSDKWKQIFAYRVDYNGSSVESFDLGLNYGGVWNALSDPVNASPTDRNVDTFTPASGWKHVVVTNPMRSGGQKTMDVYINGAYVKSVTLDIPDDATINTVSCSFFSKSLSADGYWRTRDRIAPHGTLADVKVYDGVLSAQEISDLYTAQLPRFEEYVAQLPSIEGYTFDDASFDYDGNGHTIAVVAGEGATEDVSVAYTCDGEPFTEATDVGSYEITATLTKDGYEPLELTAILTIARSAGEVLFDLDLTNFTPGATSGNSGLANAGTSLTSEIEAHGNSHVKLSIDNLYNKDNFATTKKVLRITSDEFPTDAFANNCLKISDTAFEAQDVTLSFWTNLDPVSKQNANRSYAAIVQYNAKRTDDTFTSNGNNSRGRMWQSSWETNPNGSNYTWSNNWTTGIFNVGKSKQWHHVAMVVPAFSAAGEKTVLIYVDGTLQLTEALSLDGKELADSWFSLAADEKGRYIPCDMSISELKVYSGALDSTAVGTIYDNSKDFYDNFAYNKITVTNAGGSQINHINGLADGATITIAYDENITPGIRIFAGAYDADDTLLAVNTTTTSGTGTLTLSVPEDATKVQIFTWDSSTYKIVQKAYTMIR